MSTQNIEKEQRSTRKAIFTVAMFVSLIAMAGYFAWTSYGDNVSVLPATLSKEQQNRIKDYCNGDEDCIADKENEGLIKELNKAQTQRNIEIAERQS